MEEDVLRVSVEARTIQRDEALTLVRDLLPYAEVVCGTFPNGNREIETLIERARSALGLASPPKQD